MKHENPQLKLVTIHAVLDALRQVAEECAARGEEFKLHGIVTITPRLRRASVSRHFTTGEMMEVPEHMVLVCRAPKNLKDAVSG